MGVGERREERKEEEVVESARKDKVPRCDRCKRLFCLLLLKQLLSVVVVFDDFLEIEMRNIDLLSHRAAS